MAIVLICAFISLLDWKGAHPFEFVGRYAHRQNCQRGPGGAPFWPLLPIGAGPDDLQKPTGKSLHF